jgi:hypothetical protein
VTQIITDAELVNTFAQQIMEEPDLKVETQAPSGPEVILPGGFLNNGQLITTAEVRELNGLDEEAISKTTTTGKALNLLLQRGLVKLGDKEVTSEDLDGLLSGDRDAILLGIRRVTFGETVDYSITCGNCASSQDVIVNLTTDVPVKKLTDPIADRTWQVKTKKGYVQVSLPTGITQKKLFENVDKSSAEINTMLLAGCVMSVNGEPSMGASTVLNLGIADRAKIIDEVLTRNPGPRLGEVNKVCQACGEKITFPLSLVDLFRI